MDKYCEVATRNVAMVCQQELRIYGSVVNAKMSLEIASFSNGWAAILGFLVLESGCAGHKLAAW